MFNTELINFIALLVFTIIADEGEDLTTEVIKRLGQTEICLNLTNKFEVPDDNTDITKLFIK